MREITLESYNEIIKKMRKTSLLCISLLLLLTFNCFASNNYSLTVRLNMKVNNLSLKEAIVEIKKQTEFDFLYSKDIESLYKANASFTVENATIDEVMNQLFKDNPINYQIIDKTIILTAENKAPNTKNAATTATGVQQQGITITGVVSDSESELPGVSVMIKGTTNGTTTNFNGQYSINVPNKDAILIFSYLGYTLIF